MNQKPKTTENSQEIEALYKCVREIIWIVRHYHWPTSAYHPYHQLNAAEQKLMNALGKVDDDE